MDSMVSQSIVSISDVRCLLVSWSVWSSRFCAYVALVNIESEWFEIF